MGQSGYRISIGITWALTLGAFSAHAGDAEHATFLFVLADVPVGTVELSWEPGARHYRYRSTQWFTRGTEHDHQQRNADFLLDEKGQAGGRFLVSFWLWHRLQSVGCVSGSEELGTRKGPLCVQDIEGDSVRGTVFGTSFSARYADQRLAELALGSSRFVATTSTRPPRSPPDLFAHGIGVYRSAGPLVVEPSAPSPRDGPPGKPWSVGEAQALAESVNQSAEGSCVEHAQAFLKHARLQSKSAGIVYGVWYDAESGQAFPHAWVRISLAGGRTMDLDPTLMQPVRADRYLPLAPVDGAAEFGRRVLELYAGTAHLSGGN